MSVEDVEIEALANAEAPTLVTEVPGPNAQAVLERDARVTSPSLPRAYPFVPRRGAGSVVEDVDGAAAEAGIRPGDVVLSANGKPVKSVEQLRAAVSGAKDHVALLVQRGDARIFVPVELG